MRRLALTLPVMLLILAGAGCGPSIPVPGGSVSDQGNGSVTIHGDNGATANIGSNVRVPSDFPSDVPIYAGGSVSEAATTGTGSSAGATLVFSSSDSVSTVADWYDAKLTASGWTRSGNYSVSGQESRIYEKAGATMSVTVSPGDNNGSSAIIVWGPKQ